MAVVVRNVDWMAELEFNAVITERTRLAREIHDGLAQTLGYLKIKMAQLKNYAEHGDAIRLADTTDQVIDVLNEAYGEVRASIDGLRTIPDELGLTGWLRRAVDDFQEHSGLSVQILEPVDLVPLPPEVHAQLIRIVQESLNNIRKHSGATEVQISCKLIDGDLVVEVSDNGEGFDIEDIPGPSQHGLQGMRERAELLGADFQVFSRGGEGTAVRIRLPLTYVGSQL
jgi:two-component system nitrate/nitrite sensor histidine kinase NarX